MRTTLNTDWLFHLGDEPGADFMGWDDRAWRRVTLPHDWSVEQPFDRAHASGTGYLPGGTAWYRKHFTLPEGWGTEETPHTVYAFDDVAGDRHTVALTAFDALHDAVIIDGSAVFYLIRGGFSLQ